MGTGDPYGMSISHALASGMGGIRTSGDLVARMQMTHKMRLPEAKKYVADKLKVGVDGARRYRKRRLTLRLRAS